MHLTYGHGLTDQPPEDGVSEVRSFPRGLPEFNEYVEANGFWCDDALLQARLDRRAIALVVDGKSWWVLRQQLQPVQKLCGLAEGSRCELVAFLEESNEAEGGEEGSFNVQQWPDCVAFIRDPGATLDPLEKARRATNHFDAYAKRRVVSRLFGIKANGAVLGFRALYKAADAAMAEVEAM